jgi:hypothetical protein
MLLIRIIAPHFVAGIERIAYRNRCAPILGYMQTWNIEKIQNYCKSKGWECQLRLIDP